MDTDKEQKHQALINYLFSSVCICGNCLCISPCSPCLRGEYTRQYFRTSRVLSFGFYQLPQRLHRAINLIRPLQPTIDADEIRVLSLGREDRSRRDADAGGAAVGAGDLLEAESGAGLGLRGGCMEPEEKTEGEQGQSG